MDKINRIVVIGLDGGTFKVIRPLIQKGALPNLQSLIESGVHGELQSTTPPLSPQAWTSFMTGKNPGKHGIFDFTTFRPGSYDLTFANAEWRKGTSLWKILSDHQYRVGVVNVPMTFPPEKVNGYLISGFEAPGANDAFAYPSGLYAEIKKATGEEYDIHGDFWTRKSPRAYLEAVLATMENQGGAVKYLLKRNKSDFFMAVFGSTDRIQHFYWQYIDKDHPLYREEEARQHGPAVEAVYRRADRLMGEYLELIPDPKTVFVISDHGFGPAKKVVYLDKWLTDAGYLSWVPTRFNLGKKLLKTLYIRSRRYLPRWLKDYLKMVLPDVRSQVESRLILGGIDWPNTRAFTVGVETTSVFINTRDRFPSGAVPCPSDAYEKLCEQLIQGIKSIRDPETGASIVHQIYRREEIYQGQEVKNAPDLIVLWKDYEYTSRRHYQDQQQEVVSSQLKSGVMGELMSLTNTGCHRPEGIFIASGAHIPSNAAIADARLMDVMPTILYYMGVPIPEDVDGRVLEEIFDPEWVKQHPVAFSKVVDVRKNAASNLNRDDENAIAERLRNLGYM